MSHSVTRLSHECDIILIKESNETQTNQNTLFRIMSLSLEMQSLPIVTCAKDLTNLKYGTISKWMLYDNFTVKYEWHCPEKNNYRKQEIEFENLPLETQIMIAKKAIKSSSLKELKSEQQLMLVHLAVVNN